MWVGDSGLYSRDTCLILGVEDKELYFGGGIWKVSLFLTRFSSLTYFSGKSSL